MKSAFVPLLLLATAAVAAPATERASGAGEQGISEIGTLTKAWLQLQASGQMAEGEARPMDGETADASYERYLNSFSHPIPQNLGRGENSGGSGAAGGNASSGNSGSGR